MGSSQFFLMEKWAASAGKQFRTCVPEIMTQP
jgi:hypothetical protein